MHSASLHDFTGRTRGDRLASARGRARARRECRTARSRGPRPLTGNPPKSRPRNNVAVVRYARRSARLRREERAHDRAVDGALVGIDIREDLESHAPLNRRPSPEDDRPGRVRASRCGQRMSTRCSREPPRRTVAASTESADNVCAFRRACHPRQAARLLLRDLTLRARPHAADRCIIEESLACDDGEILGTLIRLKPKTRCGGSARCADRLAESGGREPAKETIENLRATASLPTLNSRAAEPARSVRVSGLGACDRPGCSRWREPRRGVWLAR